MNPSKRTARWSLCLPLLLAVGCGGAQAPEPQPQPQPSGGAQTPAPTPAVEDAGAPSAEATDAGAPAADAAPPVAELPAMPTGLHGPARPWARMNARERGRYMNDAVLPAMSALFHAYDAQAFASPTCATCHGENARQVHFRMPNTLPALHDFGTPEAQHAMAENPRIFQFMHERVVPAMAQLLGTEPFNPQTHQGFGCFNCHPHAEH